MPTLDRQQLTSLLLITLIWGLNWPVMKLGVAHFPPLAFRAVSIGLALPLLALAVRRGKMGLTVDRRWWPRVALLGLFNMVGWHALAIVAMPLLPSGRAAILAYTMPIFSAAIGALAFRDWLPPRAWAGVAAAASGVLLLLWNEMDKLGGKPVGVALMLSAAACWALGTQLLRRVSVPVPTPTMTFWMTVETVIALAVLSCALERPRWHAPDAVAWGAILYNTLLVIGFAQTAWFMLVRALPPLASTLSVMLIPVLGGFSGAWWLGETLHWQDWTAVALMVAAIASVLWPARK